MYSKMSTKKSMQNSSMKISELAETLKEADAILIGAGSGLSTAAGFTYSGDRFQKYFRDFIEQYGITDMYTGGFYPFPSSEIRWTWWSRHIWLNRYVKAPKPVYEGLLNLVKNKDYFVLTTNVDHQFQKDGFDKQRLFYTQGDYGLFQCSEPCHRKTYDNEESVRKMVEAQGFVIEEDNSLTIPEDRKITMEIPSELVPHCPECGSEMTMNLRSDNTFVEDEGWHQAARKYAQFLADHENTKIVFLELGVGMNTPVIIKYPFWKFTAANKNAVYACVNYGQAYAPEEIRKRSICIDDDISTVIDALQTRRIDNA